MRNQRCFSFIPNADSSGELRGAPFFRLIRLGVRIRSIFRKRPHGRIQIIPPVTGDQAVTICRDEIWFILMPGNAGLANVIESMPNRVIVDYHADVLRLSSGSEAMAKAGKTTPDAWPWWSDPERQDAIRQSLIAAAVVTTPWPELVEPLEQLNPHVVLVPDTHGWDMAGFLVGWRQAFHLLAVLNSR